MGFARLRALTHLLSKFETHVFGIGRNGLCPTEGIDTHLGDCLSHRQLKVEMSIARFRALTPPSLRTSIDIQHYVEMSIARFRALTQYGQVRNVIPEE